MLEFLLSPKSITIIGASDNTAKPGGLVTRNILAKEYAGDLYPVNPKRSVDRCPAGHT